MRARSRRPSRAAASTACCAAARDVLSGILNARRRPGLEPGHRCAARRTATTPRGWPARRAARRRCRTSWAWRRSPTRRCSCVVSRLTEQKGLHLVLGGARRRCWRRAASSRCSAAATPALEAAFRERAAAHAAVGQRHAGLRRAAGAPAVRRRRRDAGALAVRALRPDADVRPAVRQPAAGAPRRRPGRHGGRRHAGRHGRAARPPASASTPSTPPATHARVRRAFALYRRPGRLARACAPPPCAAPPTGRTAAAHYLDVYAQALA